MDVPDLVTGELGDESVLASVGIGGEDEVYATPTRTLVYRGDGLLSDESVESYSHNFERLELSEGRRRSSFSLTYVDGPREFRVGSSYTQDVLRMVLAAHLRSTGALNGDEQVRGVFRFNELTLVVGTDHLLKHVGSAVWSDDYDGFPYADLTNLEFEEGSHALQLVVAADGRPERIKVPNDRAGEVRRTVEEAVFAYHDVSSLPALREAVAPAEEAASEPDPSNPGAAAAGGPADATAATDTPDPVGGEEFEEGGFRSLLDEDDGNGGATADDGAAAAGEPAEAAADPEVVERLEALEAAVEHQTELIEQQQETIEQLVDELRRGR